MKIEKRITARRRMLSKEDITGENQPVPRWMVEEHSRFAERLLAPGYPCYFGASAENRGELRYGYIEGEDLSDVPPLLREFLELSRANPKIRHALALFFSPELDKRPLSYYEHQFWETLRFLHNADEVAWPSDRPSDPKHPRWEFCFNGEPMFVFASAPAYHRRDSRNMGNSLVLLFQPRRVFDGIEGGTLAGTRAREIIRARMETWDGMEVHPDMGKLWGPILTRVETVFSARRQRACDRPLPLPSRSGPLCGGRGNRELFRGTRDRQLKGGCCDARERRRTQDSLRRERRVGASDHGVAANDWFG